MFGDLWRTHRGLFRDACDWAGEVRTVEIRKAGEGVQFFLPSASMPRGIAWARSELEKDDLLAGVAPRRFRRPVRLRIEIAHDQKRKPHSIHPPVFSGILFREALINLQKLLKTIKEHQNKGYPSALP